MVKLKALTVKVTDELHKKLKLKMAEEGTTIQDYVLKLIEEDLKKVEQKK